MLKYKFRDIIPISIDNTLLEGELLIPYNSHSLVIFSHGKENSRFNIRNKIIEKELHSLGISTFQFDLLTKEEEQSEANQLNIDLLSERLIFVTYYLSLHEECRDLRLGYFGNGNGAAYVIHSAVALPDLISTIVLCGSQLDLAINLATKVKAPTLLIVAENDSEALQQNKKFYKSLTCETLIDVIPNVTSLFKNPNTLHEAAKITGDWCNIFLQNTKEKLSA